MFGRFFAFEMGCPEEDTYLYEGEVQEGAVSETATMICECRGLGCNKCKRKKAKVITLTGRRPAAPLPVMNMPMAPFGPSMIMMGKPSPF
jgi:hypothetical protein